MNQRLLPRLRAALLVLAIGTVGGHIAIKQVRMRMQVQTPPAPAAFVPAVTKPIEAKSPPAAPLPLLAEAKYIPEVAVAKCGTVFEFVIKEKGFSFRGLEFRLWDTQGTDRILQDWRPWPLDPIVANTPGTMAFQVDVRRKDNPQIQDKRWLGQIVIGDDEETFDRNNLLRNLLADNFGELVASQSRQRLAYKLWLAAHLLVGEHRQRTPETALEKLKTLGGIGDVQWRNQQFQIQVRDGLKFEFDPRTRFLRQPDSAVWLELSLHRYSQYARIFQQMGSAGDTALAVAAVNQAIAEGYGYGGAALSHYSPVHQRNLDCGSRAVLLMQCLQFVKLNAEMVAMSDSAGAAHALVHVQLPEGANLVLDPTLGCVYALDIRKIRQAPVRGPVFPPTVRALPFLQLQNFCQKPTKVYIYNKVMPGIVPPGQGHTPEYFEAPASAPVKEK